MKFSRQESRTLGAVCLVASFGLVESDLRDSKSQVSLGKRLSEFEQSNLENSLESFIEDFSLANIQADISIGLINTVKFRAVKTSGFSTDTCFDLKLFSESTDTPVALSTKGTKSPNMAKLFVHFVLETEGSVSQTVREELSTKSTVSIPADEPFGIEHYMDQIHISDSNNTEDDIETSVTGEITEQLQSQVIAANSLVGQELF